MKLPHLFIIFIGPWEIIQKLDLEEDLLKLNEQRRTEDPGISRRNILGTAGTDSLSSLSVFLPLPEERLSQRCLFLHSGNKGSVGLQYGLTILSPLSSGNLLTFHRADFQTVLLRKLPTSYHVYCSKRLRSYEQRHRGPIALLFEDGTSTFCDVLVGADGIKSAVRRSLLGEKASRAQSQNNWSEAADITALIDPAWSGTNAYRALIPADRLRSRQSNHRALTQPMKVKYFFFDIYRYYILWFCGGSIWAKMPCVKFQNGA